MSERALILVIEDDEILGASLQQRLALEGWHVRWARSCAEALASIARQTPDAVMCDIRLPDGDGESLMRDVFARAGAVPTIFMTAYGGIDQAVRLVRMGARDYVTKPFELDEVVDKLRAATGGDGSAKTGEDDDAAADPFASFGLSPATSGTRRTLERIADVDLPVLLTGETGTGKEVAARFLHAQSRRGAGPFVAVNCAALAPELVDSALFGHEKGAFTGAHERRLGLAETAGEGTLFLDEIGELDAALQAKLLRLVQERELMRVGGVRPVPFCARLVCATHRDLEAEVARGVFREDLWYRINVVTIRIPALRERPAEIEPLLRRFVGEAGPRLRGTRVSPAPDAIAAAQAYDWPGNVRELKNRVERAVALCEEDAIGAPDLFPDALPKPPPAGSSTVSSAPAAAEGLTLAEVREAAEKAHIEAMLRATGNGIQETAQRLGVSRTTLWEKMRRLGIAVE
ncbi:sigma-54-dependent transcriptional regulator [Salinarimonas rosea]|uniref:sigma-54-dependent transcriptional regulator n=1 Tax=Salinarimonas rosea TaxID=552063 RepID=UPI00041C46F4|nr:sigma-54 dependent transcriptional regulator [Salinarimonas rosea]